MPTFDAQHGRGRTLSTGKALLAVRGLQLTVREGKNDEQLIADVTFDLGRDEFVTVLSPPGRTATALAEVAAGLTLATSGEVLFDNELVTEPRVGIGFVGDETEEPLFPWLGVRDNAALPLEGAMFIGDQGEQRITEVLTAVGLDPEAREFPGELDAGARQRIALARALVGAPALLVLNDPFARLDAPTRADLEDRLRRIRAESHLAVLHVTSDLDEAIYLGTRVVLLTSEPATVSEDLVIDLPEERDQLETRSSERFIELRTHLGERLKREMTRFRFDG